MPALLLAGASPVEALATNKLQGTFGSATAALTYARAGHVRLGDQLGMALVSALGGAAGAMVAHLIPAEVLRAGHARRADRRRGLLRLPARPFRQRPGTKDAARVFALTVVPLIAAYDGFFGPGTGSFFMMAFVLLGGFGILKATAHTKLLNFASNLGSLGVFAFSGAMWWVTGAAMAAGQVAGAALGARVAMRVGAGVIRPLLVVTSTGMALRLIWQALG